MGIQCIGNQVSWFYHKPPGGQNRPFKAERSFHMAYAWIIQKYPSIPQNDQFLLVIYQIIQ